MDDDAEPGVLLRGPWRAFLALALHVCLFALPLCLVLGLVAVAAVTARYSVGGGARAGLAAVLVGTLLGVGLRAILRARTRPVGVAVDRAGQPRLWKLAETAASAAGAGTPDEVRITIEPRVSVREDTAWLGFRLRARYLEIGLPVLAGLTVSELQAVVSHEAARLGRGMDGTARRISHSIEHALSSMVGGPTKWLFAGYAKLYHRLVDHQEAELAAVAVPVKLTGRRVTITALHKTRAIGIAWPEYAEQYLSMAIAVEHTPEVLPGFRSFLEHPRRKPELAERAKRAIAKERGEGDQPSTRQRIEAVKRVTDRDRERDDHPAVALLRNPRKTMPDLEDRLTVDGLGPRLSWPELAQKAGAAHVARQAALLSSAVENSDVGQGTGIAAVLAAIHKGAAADLINPVLNPGLHPDQLSAAVVDTVTELLGAAVVDALVSAGRAHHELDWGGPSIVRMTNGHVLDPDRLIRPAVSDPRLVPNLHRALVDLGVPLEHARPPRGEPEPELSGIVSSVRFAGRRHDLLVTDRGLLLLPGGSTPLRHLLASASAWIRRAEDDRLSELETTPVEQLRDDRGAQWVDTRDVASARMRTNRNEWVLRLDLYLDECSVSNLDHAGVSEDDEVATIELSSTRESVERGDPYGGLGDVMGARMVLDGHPIKGIEADEDSQVTEEDEAEETELSPERVSRTG